MSEDEAKKQYKNKRSMESDDEGEPACKREKPSEMFESAQLNHEVNQSRGSIEEAVKALDMIQYELNMGNVLADSPDPSDHDTPPESEDESASEDMLNQAHALGFAACVRETFRFLENAGLVENDIYKQLKSRFIETSN